MTYLSAETLRTRLDQISARTVTDLRSFATASDHTAEIARHTASFPRATLRKSDEHLFAAVRPC